MKQLTRVLIGSCLLTCLAAASMAQGAPTSQFGFTGWPYRATTSCTQTACPTCGQTNCAGDCQTTCPTCGQTGCEGDCLTATATPAPIVTPEVTKKPAPAATPVVTQRPAPTAAPSTEKPGSSSGTGDYTTVSVTAQEQSAWNLLNADRAANGLSALPLDEELSRIARIKSCDMKTNNYFAHVSPTYGNAASMLTQFGYAYKGVGENIAHHATVEKAEAAFMSSSGHKTNILGSQWTHIGIGVCYDDNGFVYVTQLFAR